MSTTTIPQLPIAVGIDGREYFEVVSPTTADPVSAYTSKRVAIGSLFAGGSISAIQPANTVLAGPTSGPDAAPSFRLLVPADIPNGLPAGGTTGQQLVKSSNADYAATWVDDPAVPEPANTVLAGPTSGPDADPTFRFLINADLPVVEVAHGGTGVTSLTAHGIVLGNGTSSVNVLGVGASGTLLTGVAGADPAFSSTPTLGVTGSVLGTLTFSGSSSGAVTVAPQAAAGTYNFNLPITAGTAGQPLLSGGGGASPMAFGTLSVPGGGTGATSFTAYAVLCGGTTSTGQLQSVASVGTTGQALLSNGPGALPTFQDAATAIGQALSKTDDTNVTLTLGGSPNTALLAATSLTLGWAGQLGVSRGGTGLSSGTSGGILGFTASGTLASSVALTANQIVLGGGAGATPVPLGSLGTTTTVLHGNASGAPTFGAVSLTADISGILPLANGGTAANLTAPGADRVFFYDFSALSTAFATATNGLEFNTTDLQMTTNQRTRTIFYVIDGGGSTITTGIKGDLPIDINCTIQSAELLADQTGSIVVDIWKDTYANYPPTVGDSITSSAPPTISSAVKSLDSTLTGWTKTITAGDTLRFNVNSITSITRCTLGLKVLVT